MGTVNFVPKQTLLDQLQTDLSQPSDGKDIIFQLAHHIENFKSDEARVLAQKFISARGFNSFVLGGILTKIFYDDWYREYGYSSFNDFVQEELGMSKSAAYDHRKLYEHIVDEQLPWDKLQHIGWTKLRWIIKYINNKNIGQWTEKAESLNAVDLMSFAKSEAATKLKVDTEAKIQSTNVKESSTQVEPEVMSGAEHVPEVMPEASVGSPLVTTEAAQKTSFKKIFSLYPEQQEVVDQALKFAMASKHVNHQNVALTNICLHFVSSYVHDDEDIETPPTQ